MRSRDISGPPEHSREFLLEHSRASSRLNRACNRGSRVQGSRFDPVRLPRARGSSRRRRRRLLFPRALFHGGGKKRGLSLNESWVAKGRARSLSVHLTMHLPLPLLETSRVPTRLPPLCRHPVPRHPRARANRSPLPTSAGSRGGAEVCSAIIIAPSCHSAPSLCRPSPRCHSNLRWLACDGRDKSFSLPSLLLSSCPL